MGQGHGERLTALDAAFLEMETPTMHMHVGGLFVFDSPASGGFSFERFVRLVRSRLHLVPRYRQKLAFTPLNLANPVWVDDRDFDLAYHVRHAALPRPGTIAQLTEYAARILSRPLDRDRPLWELYVVEGLADGGFAIIGKNHHAMIDGLAGIDIATVMLDLTDEVPDEVPLPEPWDPEAPPSDYDLTASAVRGVLHSPGELVGRVRRAAAAPGEVARQALQIGQGVASLARSSATGMAPRTIINQPPGMSRRLGIQRIPLEDVKAVKNVFGTTVNDVVLALVADVVGRYLRGRGARTDGLELRAMVPVSVRTDDEAHALGNKVTSVFIDLPVGEMDPVARLEICARRMAGVKGSHSAVGADFLLNLTQFAPPTIHALGARAAARSRLFNLVVTNVPGPQVPIYCLGARLLGCFPFVPLSATQSLAVGLTSLDGWMNFGFTCDYQAIPDPERFGDLLKASLAELQRSATARREQHDRAMSGPSTAAADGAAGASEAAP